MASRQLRKLRQKQEALNLETEASVKDEESEDEPVAKPRPNMFSGFAALGSMDDDHDDDDDEDEKDEEPKTDDEKPTPKEASSQAQPAKKSKKSKKKKKKGKQADTTPGLKKNEPEPEDEIDRVLAELKLEDKKKGQSSSAAPSSQSATYEEDRLAKLLSINFQHLKYMNEMRRLFGKAMDAAQVEERAQENQQRALPEDLDLETYLSARAAHPSQGQQAKSGMFETILRTNPFIEGKKTWPRGASQGLKMVRIGDQGKAGDVEFAFSHDKTYDDLEGNFFGLVQMYDPMQIVHFLYQHPYHVSSLIQVSKVARQDQNTALAADLIDRALFTFGRVSLSEFRKKLEQGKARLDFNRPENRQLWLAGWNLIQKLTLKGTYRTALEWTKLLLSLSADDPYALINWVHVLAIRAREAQWFIDLCYNPLFRLNHLQSPINYMRQTLPLAYLQLEDTENARSHLVEGIESFPWLYCSLCSALNIDTPKSIWGVMPRDEDETLHTELYIHMSKDLWNTPAAISLLKEAATAAKPPKDISTLPKGPSVSLSTARFVYLDNTPSLLTLVPRGIIHNASPNYDFDPLPPAKLNNIFSSETQKRPWNNERPRLRDDEAGMQAAARRLLGQVSPEELEEALREGGVGGGLWDFLMRRGQGGGAANAAGGGGAGTRARGRNQAFVEDADDDDGDDIWGDAEDDHDLPDEEDDFGDGAHEQAQGHGRGGNWAGMAGQMPRWIWEAIAGTALDPEFAQDMYDEDEIGAMPGAWGDDSEDEYEYIMEREDRGHSTDEDMPALEDPNAAEDRAHSTDEDMPPLEDPNAPEDPNPRT
ncbi:ribosome quality control complex subunit 1 [Cladorrhinum sp. PSN259]|nr:ribosome quality control complex subunit 1 [Cladorrhinum sp. PSN259]